MTFEAEDELKKKILKKCLIESKKKPIRLVFNLSQGFCNI